jgi:hypothetical protein
MRHGAQTLSLFKGLISALASDCKSFAAESTVCAFLQLYIQKRPCWLELGSSSTTEGGRSMMVAYANIVHKSERTDVRIISSARGYEFPLLPVTKAKLTLHLSAYFVTLFTAYWTGDVSYQKTTVLQGKLKKQRILFLFCAIFMRSDVSEETNTHVQVSASSRVCSGPTHQSLVFVLDLYITYRY